MNQKLVLMVIIATIFTSCKKYEVSEPLDLSKLSTVTVKGTLYANLDQTNSILEYVPEGLKVTASIPYSDYDINNTSGGNHILTATIDKKGSFSIDIPVLSTGVNVKISFESFTYDVLKGVGTDTLRELTQFTLPIKTVNGLGKGNSAETVKLSENYAIESTDTNSMTFTPTTKVKFSGTVTFLKEHKKYTVITTTDTITRDTNIFAPIPAGVSLIVDIVSKDEHGREFKQTKTVKTTASGSYEIEVPVVYNGSADIKIKSNEIWQYEDRVTGKSYLYNYELNVTKTIYFVDYKNQDYKYVQGDLVYEVE